MLYLLSNPIYQLIVSGVLQGVALLLIVSFIAAVGTWTWKGGRAVYRRARWIRWVLRTGGHDTATVGHTAHRV